MRLGAVTSLGEPAPADDERRLREYRLLERIGRGVAGEVWKAEAPGGFLVALKFVPLSGHLGRREAEALGPLRTIRHPNLLVTFGSWVVDAVLVIAMELADRTLQDRFEEAARDGLPGIPRDELLGYLGDAARGLDHLGGVRYVSGGAAHVGLSHRGVTPRNLLLFGGGVKVADLGLARPLDAGAPGPGSGESFAFAAPELFRGEPSRWSDQYALAATYCRLRTGRPPFAGTPAEVLVGQLMSPPDLAGLPAEERPIVARALAKEPSARWPSCRALVEALLDVRPGRAAAARPDAGEVDWLARSFDLRGTGIGEDAEAETPGEVPIDPIPAVGGPGPAGVVPGASAGPDDAADPATRPSAGPERESGPGRLGWALASALGIVLAVAALRASGRREPPEPAGFAATAAPPAPPRPGRADPTPPRAEAEARDDEAEAEASEPAEPGEAVAPDEGPSPDPAPADQAPAAEIEAAEAEAEAREPEAEPGTAAESNEAGLRHYHAGRLEEALAEFDRALRLDPTNAKALKNRGALHWRAGRPEAAIADLEGAVALDPDDVVALNNRGLAYRAAGRYDRALASYDAALRRAPADPVLRFNRAYVLARLGRDAEAIDELTEAIRLDPAYARAYRARAEARARRGDRAGAEADRERASALEASGDEPR